jgi:aquaporin Z
MGEDSAAAKYLAEFVGTFMLVLTVGCNVLTGSPVWAVTSIACTLMVSIYALGGVSGANFNPAVSLSLGICNKLPWKDVGVYMGVQIAGGICAGLVYGLALWDVFNLQPTAGFAFWQAALAEILYTFMLCFVVLNVAASRVHGGQNQFYGLAIGFVVVAGGYGAGHISGGCFNPAVAIGIDVSSAGIGFGWCLAYTIFEFIGAAAASALFGVVRPEEKNDDPIEAPGTPQKVLSEFLGTFFLVLTVGLNVIGGSKAPVFSIAASLMCMIFALGSVSGAHFNPAVTVAILASGRDCIKPADAGIYIGVQIVAGIVAGFTYCAMEGGKSFPLAPGKGYGWAEAAVAEIVFTFLLCFVVLSVATVKAPLSEYFGLAIGSCVTAGGYAIGAVSGGSLNPAVSFGISMSHAAFGGGASTIANAIGYSLFEIIGGAIAAGVFMATHPTEYAKGDDEGAGQEEAATA